MAAQKSQKSHEPCNTGSRARHWSFTWNNPPSDWKSQLTQYFDNSKYTIGEEEGKSGTPHLQGSVSFVNQKNFGALKKAFPDIHWEVTKNVKASHKYCEKEGKVTTNIEKVKTLDDQYDDFMKEEYKDVVWHDWQQHVLEIINGPVQRRKVHWFHETMGNVGKSFLARYIEWKYDTIIMNGKQADVFNGVKTYLEKKEIYPKVIILDIPRTHENYVCYSTMEKIKDGLFYSGKYEGGVCRLLPVHLIVFANFHPKTDTMSMDRWDIHNI